MLSELGACVGYLAQCQHWADQLANILSLVYDISDPDIDKALNCLNHHIPLVREKIIAVAEEERQRIQEERR